MDRAILERLVLPGGTLDPSLIRSREVLYIGRNGKAVERFVPNDSSESFLFKPLTNFDTFGREQWAYANLLPFLSIRYPVMHAFGKQNDPQKHWAIYEDMGRLEHQSDEHVLLQAAEAIPQWHNVALDHIPDDFTGHTPYVDVVLAEVTERWADLKMMLSALGASDDDIAEVEAILQRNDRTFPTDIKLSHGDYHPYNFAWNNGELVVLDWEYVHKNSVYWDLYNLLDMTSPKYRRNVVSPALREKVLQAYWRTNLKAELDGRFEEFKRQYFSYALIHCLWILLLIDGDLQAGKFDEDALLEQQRETFGVLWGCVAGYEKSE